VRLDLAETLRIRDRTKDADRRLSPTVVRGIGSARAVVEETHDSLILTDSAPSHRHEYRDGSETWGFNLLSWTCLGVIRPAVASFARQQSLSASRSNGPAKDRTPATALESRIFSEPKRLRPLDVSVRGTRLLTHRGDRFLRAGPLYSQGYN